MLYTFFLTLYVLVCILLILVILAQKGKSSLGIGAFGGGSQMLFGAGGGQDLLQKITWGLGIIFMVGSLALSLVKTKESKQFQYIKSERKR